MQLKIWKGRCKKYCAKERLEVAGILEEMWQQQGFASAEEFRSRDV
ncbi:MAG: hypothetical protein J6C11_04125 [Spirochaetaceae bacterium]|nr:hypothetical protein [Spirochaetaceae bacterium]